MVVLWSLIKGGGDKITKNMFLKNFTPINVVKGSKCSPCNKLFNVSL
jgi:hypothetical protein